MFVQKQSTLVDNDGEFSFIPPQDPCVECGAEINTRDVWWRFAEDMVKDHVCGKCSHWIDQLRLRDKYTVIVDYNGQRHHYRVKKESGKSPAPAFCRGHGGQRFKIRFLDGRILETTNLWHQGEVPERFLDRFPVNAEFVYNE